MRGARRGASASRGWRKSAASSKSIRKSRRRERFSRPKRAVGAYMFFCKDQYASISADNPNIPFGDVGRILGSRWQQLSEKDKKVSPPFSESMISNQILAPFLHNKFITNSQNYTSNHYMMQREKREKTRKISSTVCTFTETNLYYCYPLSHTIGECIMQPYIKKAEADKKRYEKELKRSNR